MKGRAKIRREGPADRRAVRTVHGAAFGRVDEGDLVDTLRADCPGIMSLVACQDSKVCGHILFSPVKIGEGDDPRGMGLAPLAVHPDYQDRGIGSALVREGLRQLAALSCPFVVVLGEPEYYSRFGFETARDRGLNSQWKGIPETAFMVRVLDEASMAGVQGTVWYREEFNCFVS